MQETRPRVSVPAIGPWVPTATLHWVFLAVAVGLCLLVLPSPSWVAAGLLLAAAVTLLPNLVPMWWLLLLLGLSQLWREPSATDPAFYLLLAGVHLLHLLGGLARVLPRGRMQVGALVRPLRRFFLVQVVAQALAVSALLAFDGAPGTVPGLSVLAAGALGFVAAVLARQLRQPQPRGDDVDPRARTVSST